MILSPRLSTHLLPNKHHPQYHSNCNIHNMAPNILVVLTSHDKLGDSGKPTGWFLVSSLDSPTIALFVTREVHYH